MQLLDVYTFAKLYTNENQSLWLYDVLRKRAYNNGRRITRNKINNYKKNLKTFYVVQIGGIDFEELEIKFVRKEDLNCESEEGCSSRAARGSDLMLKTTSS